MALITCPECGKQISDKALSCPNCGLPLSQDTQIGVSENKQEEINTTEQIIPCPTSFPSDLRIGQQITNWTFDAAFEGFYSQTENTITSIPSGKVQVLLHTHGVRVFGGLNMFDIHNSQIINIIKTSSAQLVQANKSVIGRAVVGSIIMGPLGAIVGGMSGLSTKDKLLVTQYVVINFWDVELRSPQSLLIQCDNAQPIDAFIARQKKEAKTNITENRVAEEEHTPVWAIICIIIIIISVIMIFTA